ncbi:HNH endonuclease family protein [Lunatibacter salilacus]|uniref:aminoglycoside phosphotransferase n=1 Tax=Lunatibacter salilacus TaxID=2483804 RepID=UPI00131AB1E4|nr:aminoglycoside phosphotransferase [Lunatibacter salilacus]
MLYLNDRPLTAKAASLLVQYQKAVDDKPTFSEKTSEGKKLFARYNKKSNDAFKVVRGNLAEMSGGTIRCNYCEDSNANQVEHIYPKNFYPEKCFVWENYCYACGPCNQPKSDKFAIFEDATGNELNLKTIPKDTAPPKGKALLVDPRADEPLEYLFLDTQSTFRFVPFIEDANDYRRAEYTIEILGLNSRNHLVRARKVAFGNFKARLFEYVAKKESGATAAQLNPLIDSLKSEHHQTVWHEMIRQRSLHPELDDLFNRAPEALEWAAFSNQ